MRIEYKKAFVVTCTVFVRSLVPFVVKSLFRLKIYQTCKLPMDGVLFVSVWVKA